MPSSIQKSPEIHSGHGLAVATLATVGATMLVDQVLGAHGNTSRHSEPGFHTSDTAFEQTVAVVPGCQSDGELLYNELSPLFTNVNLIVTDYPKHGFDVKAICEGLAQTLIEKRAERPALLGISMGGMVLRHFLHYAEQTGAAKQLGGFGRVVLDSSPYDARDISLRHRFLLGTAWLTQFSYTADHLKQRSLAHADHNFKRAHISAIHGQGKFMHGRHPKGPLPDIMESVTYVQGPRDHVINTNIAARKYLADIPQGKGHYFTDEDRHEHQHTATPANFPFLIKHLGLNAVQSAEYELLAA